MSTARSRDNMLKIFKVEPQTPKKIINSTYLKKSNTLKQSTINTKDNLFNNEFLMNSDLSASKKNTTKLPIKTKVLETKPLSKKFSITDINIDSGNPKKPSTAIFPQSTKNNKTINSKLSTMQYNINKPVDRTMKPLNSSSYIKIKAIGKFKIIIISQKKKKKGENLIKPL